MPTDKTPPSPTLPTDTVQVAINLKKFAGLLPQNFQQAVQCLRRPYIPISEDDYNHCLAVLNRPPVSDLFLMNDVIVTVGNADGGYAIMPLSPEEQARYIQANPRLYQQLT